MAAPQSRIAKLSSRVQDLFKLRASVFRQSYNPTLARTGGKILRQRLKGPSVAAYYPPRPVTLRDIRRIAPFWETYNDKQAEREDHIVITKARGKGAPKKKRTADESKKFKGKRGGGAAAKPTPEAAA